MKILHLSDTTLSGSPYRLSTTYNKYSGNESRHMVWQPIVRDRVFPIDLCSSELSIDEIKEWFDWADIIHYHNRYKNQMVFTKTGLAPPKKTSLIQIHSPRDSEDFKGALELPIAVIAQYHVRQWPELRFIVPNVVDIYDPTHMPIERPIRTAPVVCYSPSNAICKGWDDKSYATVSPVLKRMQMDREIQYQRLVNLPFTECMKLKQNADIGVDEVTTGSYHMSSLEFLSMGVPCFGKIDAQCEKVIKDLTGADWLPWLRSSETSFKSDMTTIVKGRCYAEIGRSARAWMEKYWDPNDICDFFTDLYKGL